MTTSNIDGTYFKTASPASTSYLSPACIAPSRKRNLAIRWPPISLRDQIRDLQNAGRPCIRVLNLCRGPERVESRTHHVSLPLSEEFGLERLGIPDSELRGALRLLCSFASVDYAEYSEPANLARRVSILRDPARKT